MDNFEFSIDVIIALLLLPSCDWSILLVDFFLFFRFRLLVVEVVVVAAAAEEEGSLLSAVMDSIVEYCEVLIS